VSAASARSGAAVVAAPTIRPPDQLRSFEAGLRLFHERQYRDARSLFEAATKGPDLGVAHKAQLHMRVCERRMEQPTLDLHSAEDHYNYAVAQINVHNLSTARQHLQAALLLDSKADHIYYAMALCLGLTGDLEGAYENLKRAIELQPRNRIAARQDVDFAPFINQPPFDRLLYPDKNVPF
jgi:Tfp pilus assembly protein PilF